MLSLSLHVHMQEREVFFCRVPYHEDDYVVLDIHKVGRPPGPAVGGASLSFSKSEVRASRMETTAVTDWLYW